MRISGLVAFLAVVTCSSAGAQDAGIPDTVALGSVQVDAGDHFPMKMIMTNDLVISASSLGIIWGTGDLTLDSVSFVGSVVEGLPEFQKKSIIDNVTHTALVGFFGFELSEYAPSGRGTLATFWFTAAPGASDQTITIDSAFFPPNGDFILIDGVTFSEYPPQWIAGTVTIGNPVEPPTIGLSVDSFYFSAVEGPLTPPAQVLGIENVGIGTLNWTATRTSSWLGLAPFSGTAPSLVQVTANSNGLSVGSYYDTIVVSDPQATNNPLWVAVQLDILEPPPILSVTPSALFFNAVKDLSNPDPETLIVKNTGQSVLNWTGSNNESWLTLNPSFGGDSTDVSVEIDISGLPFGEYVDTIVISDPAAQGSPRRIPVSLSVASDLPILSLEPETLTVIVDLNTAAFSRGSLILFDTAYFDVLNDGAGSMTFDLSESSSRISGMDPASGSAPQTVALSLKLTAEPPGFVYDTVWVSSPSAINSPQPLIVRYYFTSNPATIMLSSDTLDFTLFECEQGESYSPGFTLLGLGNFGESVSFTVESDIDWLSTPAFGGVAPTSIPFNLTRTDHLVAGELFDSVRIYAPLATNPVIYVFMRLTVIPAERPAVIFPASQDVTIVARENSSFLYCPIDILRISNFHGGCFDWEVQETVSWLTLLPASGRNPAAVGMIPDGTGMAFGQYQGQFDIVSAEAENSPKTINVTLKVWRYFGDANYNGTVNVADVIYILNYIFIGGPAPEPVVKVGDTNCNLLVNVADAVRLMDYIFGGGSAPCGN